MATVNISDSANDKHTNVFVTNGTVGSQAITYGTIVPGDSGTRYVEIDTQLIDDISVKEPIILSIPTQFREQPRKGGSSTPNTQIVDLIKIKRTITITGTICDDGTTSALNKKKNLIEIFEYGGTFTIVWGTGTGQQKHTVNTTKYQIKNHPNAYVDSGSLPATTPKKGYDVMLQFIVGTDRGG